MLVLLSFIHTCHTQLGKAVQLPHSLNLPQDGPIAAAPEYGPMPYVIVGDEAFPLQVHLTMPYSGRNATLSQQGYKYRHSRARRIVECAFDILSALWRAFHTKLAVLPETVTSIPEGSRNAVVCVFESNICA